jgi:hypothetical protein
MYDEFTADEHLTEPEMPLKANVIASWEYPAISESEVPRNDGVARAAVLSYPQGWFRAVVYGPAGGISHGPGIYENFGNAARESMRMLIRDYGVEGFAHIIAEVSKDSA